MDIKDNFADRLIVWRGRVLPVKTIEPVLSDVVAKVFNVPQAYILFSRRYYAPIAFARQVAIYLCHTVLGLKYQEIGNLFGRERTSVAHACRRVEDQRDSASFNQAMCYLEHAVLSYFQSITCEIGSKSSHDT